MLSICCCAINAKWDVEVFVRTLVAMNPNFDFEVIVTHDDRVNDGSSEHFAKLAQEIPQLKIVTHSEQDTVDYFRGCIDHYESSNLFNPSLRQLFRDNLDRYIAGEFVDRDKTFLWQSSGPLYNKAVAASSGDVLLVTPGDFIYLFSLEEIYNFVKQHQRNNFFYASPPAIWARITNLDPEWLDAHIASVYDGTFYREGWRWDSLEIFRDYLQYPPKGADLVVPYMKENTKISLNSPDSFPQLAQFCEDSLKHNMHQVISGFHGFHIMTRQTFDLIGGFTEEWFHRAFADDKMTALGVRSRFACGLPIKFSVAWCGQGEISSCQGPCYKEGWQDKLKEIDPWCDTHPLPSSVNPRYLFSDTIPNHYAVDLTNRNFNVLAPPVRIIK